MLEKKTKVKIDKLINARKVFETFRKDIITERDEAGAIKAFEFSYELSWKMMKRVLAANGIDTTTPKDVFRAAASAKIIDNPEDWFDFQEMRNL